MSLIGSALPLVCAAAALESAATSGSAPLGTIAYSSGGQVWVLNLDHKGARRVASGTSPAWSPDGREIVFQSARIPGDGKDIYVMDATGTNQRHLVTHPGGGAPGDTGNDFDPTWAPNDDIIVFTSDRSGSADIWRTNSIGHATDQLTSSAADEGSAAWSPDGTRIAFVSNATGTDQIDVINADGNDSHALTQDPVGAADPAWSPTGDRLAFVSFRDGHAQIYEMSSQGRNIRRLTQDAATDTRPAWSPDGSRILFLSDRDSPGRPALFTVDPSGGPAKAVPIATAQAITGAAWRPAVDLAMKLRPAVGSASEQVMTLRVEVRNLMATTATGVSVEGRSMTGTRSNVLIAGSRCAGVKNFVCSLSDIPAKRTVQLTMRVKLKSCGIATAVLSADALQPDIDLTSNSRRTQTRGGC